MPTPCRTTRDWFADTPVSVCSSPSGQTIRTSAMAERPSPKCCCFGFLDRKSDSQGTSRRSCEPSALTTMTSRLLRCSGSQHRLLSPRWPRLHEHEAGGVGAEGRKQEQGQVPDPGHDCVQSVAKSRTPIADHLEGPGTLNSKHRSLLCGDRRFRFSVHPQSARSHTSGRVRSHAVSDRTRTSLVCATRSGRNPRCHTLDTRRLRGGASGGGAGVRAGTVWHVPRNAASELFSQGGVAHRHPVDE
jgi:hypothetical protein